jgi:hypothetical protein
LQPPRIQPGGSRSGACGWRVRADCGTLGLDCTLQVRL